jgi:hypothetical protein
VLNFWFYSLNSWRNLFSVILYSKAATY